MFLSLFTFEIRYWLRQPMVWIFMLVNIIMFAWAAASDDLSIGGSFGNIYKNAPYVIQSQYGVWTIFALLMTTAFVQNAALRDFTYNSHQLVFSSPIRKIDYLAGRFLGSFCVALIPFLGTSIGILLGTLIGQATGSVEPDRYGPVVWSAHVNAFLTFAVGNTFVSGTFIFMLAALSRSTVVAFVGAVLLLVAQAIAGNLLADLDNEKFVAYFDALGFGPFELVTKYWTVADKNTRSVGLLDGDMGLNRLIWFGVGLVWLGITYARFSFAERVAGAGWLSRKRKKDGVATAAPAAGFGLTQPLPRVRIQTGAGAQWAQMVRVAKTDFWGTIRGVAFLVILLAGLLNMGFSLRFAGRAYGLANYPVTYAVIQQVQGTMGIFLFAIIIFYSGDLIWKERDANLDQMYDATPHRNWSVFVGKLLAMIGVVAVIQVICVAAGVVTQTLMGYTAYDFGQYAAEFFVISMARLIPIIVLSMLLHTLVNNKYVAFFAVVVVLIANGNVWGPLDVQSNLAQFNASPGYTYSDMNGWGPYVAGLAWFRTYWLLFTALLGVAAVLFWVRGKDTAWQSRRERARQQFEGLNKRVALGILAVWVAVGGFLVYNTKGLNSYVTPKVQENRQVAYERTYKKYEHRPQPRIIDVAYTIDLYPAERELAVKGTYRLTNRTSVPIDSLHIVLPNRMHYTLSIAGAKRVLNDSIHQYQMYRLARPMAPGDSLTLTWTAHRRARGIENEVEMVQQVNQNGSFFNNGDISPQIGYQKDGELSGKNDRKEKGLPERERAPKLQRNRDGGPCTDACMNHYIGGNADWVNVRTTISTSPDQLAVAPGSLKKEWAGNDAEGRPRRYFSYALDHESLNFYSFISARFEVDRAKWNGIDVEVYYDKQHAYNVKNMSESIKQSLAYYTRNFGPYRHKQARIIEFPRYAGFAQAFPGTMPYSESIGFISKIDPETDIDMVKYVVAHEMGHQWWAHQVIGAEMQGATLLSETLAQYSALMVMQKAYGRDRMKRFLSYEGDNYLSSRGTEAEKEVSIEKVENQGYIHYRKGSLVMFNLKEFIGEKAVNNALRDLTTTFAYRKPPYPTAYELVDRLRQNTPDSLQSTITDLFEQITIYDNRATASTAKKRKDGQYEVTLTVQTAKLRADSLGRETPLPLNDLIDVGVYGKPVEGKKIGKLLAIRCLRMKAGSGTYSFIVREQPHEAGVDPLSYLADRIPADNMKRVTGL